MMCSDIVHPLAAGPVSARFLRNERHVLPESLVTGGVYDCALMPVSFSIVSRSVRCSMEKALCPEATADTAAELGCGISPHMSFRSARLRIGVMLRFLRCRDHAVTWCAGRESCRSLDGSRTAQTDQSRSNQFTRIASTAAWPMNRKAKTCAAALRRGSDSDSAIPGRQEPGKEEKDTSEIVHFFAQILLVSF